MRLKIKIAIMFLLAIAISSGYFLWQIDRHEKALFGQEWLNPVPNNIWQKYLTDKADHEKKLAAYRRDNSNLISKVKQYKQNRQSQYLPEEIDLNAKYGEFYIPKNLQAEYSLQYPNEAETLRKIILDLILTEGIPPRPSNPPKYIIQQSITSLYRYMALTEIVMLLGFSTFLFLYKEPQKQIFSDNK